ncbi:unnamed protein product [Polarella glacialis]|uniref:Uncharacterized protein n=1 Tax=Polarella glacialis TaxID=89957 RepID=A0A813JVC8_POLGL|nr:unnamed protein product [Polarella glacialis]
MSRSPDSAVLRFEVGAVCFSIELPADPEVALADTFETAVTAVAALRLSLGARRAPASSEAPTAPWRASAAASSAAAADNPTATAPVTEQEVWQVRLDTARRGGVAAGKRLQGFRAAMVSPATLLQSRFYIVLRGKGGDTSAGAVLGFRRWSDVVEVVCEEVSGSTRRVPAALSVFQGFPSKMECEHFVAGAGIQLPINWSA